MANNQNSTQNSMNQSGCSVQTLEQDLLNALLPRDAVQVRHNVELDDLEISVLEQPQQKIAYPWSIETAGDFLDQADQAGLLQHFDDEEISLRSSDFFNKLEQVWDVSLLSILSRKFVGVPQTILSSIAAQAERLATSSVALADQLVQCTQEALPMWATEDLYVFARPLAYAMRGDDSSSSSDLLQRDWASLSAVEQAKLTVAIARYALNQVD